MIKVKDGYGKLIGTTYQGSADHLLRSNGDTWAVHTGRNNEANKIVRTDSNGQLQVGWINTTSGNLGTANITRIYCSNDDYIRYKTPENFFSTLSNNGDNISITIASQNRTLVVGYSKVAGQLRSKGTISPQTGRTQSLGDVYSYHLNGSVSGGPTKYASVIGFGRGTSGTVEIAGEWTSGRGLWVRALRDTTDNWYAWDKVLTQATYTGITDSRYYTKTQADERFVNITGDTMTGELINSSANAYRLKQSNYGVILRNDNNSFWILLTNSGSPSGSYNSLRPFRINLPDGRVTIGNGLSVTGTIVGSSTIQGTQLISTIADGTAPLKVTSKTVVTNLNSDLLDGYHETSFFRARGSQTIASSIPTTTELSSNNNLSGNWNVTYPGASGHLVQFNAGSGSTRYMQFYSYHSGSLYWRNSTDSTLNTKSWKTVVDSANYTGIVLKIGTATKGSATLPIYLNAGTPTACSTTLGVSITGNAATANRILSHTISDTLANKTTPGYLYHAGGSNSVADKPSGVDAFGVFTMQTASGWYGQILMSSNTSTGLYWRTATTLSGGWKKILDSSNYTSYINPANFVTALGTSGNYLTWTKNGVVNNLTVPYATASSRINSSSSVQNTGLTYYSSGSFVVGGTAAGGQWGMPSDSQDAAYKNGQCLRMYWGSTYYTDILSGPNNMGTTHGLYMRQIVNGAVATGTFAGGWRLILDSYNYHRYGDTRYVTSLGTNGTYVTWVKNGTTNNLTVPYSSYSGYLQSHDTRSTNNTPAQFSSGARFEFKYNSTDGLSNGGTYHGILHFKPYGGTTDFSGGQTHQLGFTDGGNLYMRTSTSSSAWGSWKLILTQTTADGRYVTSLGTNGNYLTWTKAGTTNNITVPYATNSNKANYIYYGSISNLNSPSSWTSDGYRLVYDTYLGSASNKPVSYDNANGIITLFKSKYGTSNQYVSQLAFPNNTRMYFRYASAGSFSSWYTIAYTSDIKDPANYYWANVRVSASSNSGTSPTFNTCYTSNWFRSTGSTGWYSESYGGGWYMTDSTWIRTYGSKSVYQNTGQIRTDGYLVTNGGLTAGATSPNNGTYKLHVTGASWSSGLIRAGGGFYHNSVNSNSYVLLAGGSYKGLGDFAKGNAGSATKGVYVTGGTVTAMTYSLSSNLNSGTSGKLAYYSSATTVAAYSSSVGASNRGIYMNAGVPTVMAYYLNATVNSGTSGKLAYYSDSNTLRSYTSTVGSAAQPIYLNAGSPSASSYSFTGTYSNPVIVWCGEIYRSAPGSTYWYSTKKGGCCSISFTTNNAGSNGNLIISIPHCEPYAAFCSTVRIFDGSTAISAGDGTISGRSAGMGDYMTICGISGTTGNVYIRKFSQQNKQNDTWRNGELGTTTTSDGNKPVARFYLMIVGRYI